MVALDCVVALGSRPFEGPTDGAIFSQIANAPPAQPSELSRRIDKGFEALILRALEKDPELRFQTAHDLRADLRRLQRAQLRRQSRRPMLCLARPRRQLGALALAAICGMALASAGWYALRPSAAPLPSRFQRMTFGEGEEIYPNLSADGKQFIYASSVCRVYKKGPEPPIASHERVLSKSRRLSGSRKPQQIINLQSDMYQASTFSVHVLQF